MKVIQELVAYFDRRGKLSRRQLRGLLDRTQSPPTRRRTCTVYARRWASPTISASRAYPRASYGAPIFTVVIRTIGAAAVHAGLLKPGETDLLRVTVVTPPEKFPGTVRNGVTSTEYGRYQYAWRLSAI